jgi:apolipoprotein N-acyltransferase
MERTGTWTNLLLKNVTLIMFLALLGVIYIANVHVAERKQLKIEEMKKDVQQMKWQYMGIEKDLLLYSSPSVMEKKMEREGLKYSSDSPKNLSLEKTGKNEGK